MSEWKPIESAPKDGRLIIGYDESMFGVCLTLFREDGWFINQGSQDGMGYENMPITHWMPLPEPPK